MERKIGGSSAQIRPSEMPSAAEAARPPENAMPSAPADTFQSAPKTADLSVAQAPSSGSFLAAQLDAFGTNTAGRQQAKELLSSDAWKSSSLAHRSPEDLQELSKALDRAEQTHARSAANPMRLFSSARANATGKGQTLEQVIAKAKSELIQAASDKALAGGRMSTLLQQDHLSESEQQELSRLSKIACFAPAFHPIVPGAASTGSLLMLARGRALHSAARQGNVDTIGMLLRPENRDELQLLANSLSQKDSLSSSRTNEPAKELANFRGVDRKTPLELATEGNHLEAMRMLLPLTEDNFSRIQAAVMLNEPDVARDALATIYSTADKYNLQPRGFLSMLQTAHDKGFDQVKEELLQSGRFQDVLPDFRESDVDALQKVGVDGNRLLLVAAQKGWEKAMDRFLSDPKIDIDAAVKGARRPNIALSRAVESKNAKAVEALIAKGADVNLADEMGWTPLHYAAAGGNGYAVALLAAAGANLNAKNNEGKTPADVAATPLAKKRLAEAQNQQMRTEVLNSDSQSYLSQLPQELRAEVANFAERRKGTASAAVQAAKNGQLGLLEGLAKIGQDLSLKDENNQTPLQAAIAGGHQPAIDWLMNQVHGLDPESLQFQRDVLAQIQSLPAPERATALQRLTYEMNQVVLDRNQAQQFAGSMEGRNLDSLVDAFQSNSKGWSALQLVDGQKELDPAGMMGFDDMLARARALRAEASRPGSTLASMQEQLSGENLHVFDRKLLDTVARHEFRNAGKSGRSLPLNDREQNGLRLLYQQLLDEPFTTASAAPAAAAAQDNRFAGEGRALNDAAEGVSALQADDSATRRQRILAALAKRG